MKRTKAQDRAIARLKKRHGPVLAVGNEPDGETIRVRLLGREIPADERERIISASGIVQEPVA